VYDLRGSADVGASPVNRNEKMLTRLCERRKKEMPMATTTKPIPDGFERATPYLCCKDAARAIEFYKKAFGAVETMRLAEPSGRIGHAEIKIGDAPIMLSDEYPEMDVRSPLSFGGSPVMIHLYVADVDALAKQAVAAGATLVRPLEDQFYGDRSGTLADPFGHRWMIATHKEDVSPEEMGKRYAALMKQ
jgi:PhnB protein